MIISDALSLSSVAFSLAASGPISTAILSVDIASNFAVTSTAALQVYTLPTPTSTVAGQVVFVTNAVANTNSYTVQGYKILPGEYGKFVFDGTTWLVADGGRNMGAIVTLATMTVGNNSVLHNLVMPTGSFSNLTITALNSTGSQVFFKRVLASDTASTCVVSSPVAVSTPTVFYVTPLV